LKFRFITTFLKVTTAKPYQVIYSIYQHQFLGYLFEAYAVQTDNNGRLTLDHKSIGTKNAKEFADKLNEADYQIIKLIEEITQEAIHKRFSPKKSTLNDFYLKTYDSTKGDKLVQDQIENYIERRKAEILKLLPTKKLFVTSDDGEPAIRQLQFGRENAHLTFHFHKQTDHTRYFVTLEYKGNRQRVLYPENFVLCNTPGYVVVTNMVFALDNKIDGQKLKPFFSKQFIEVRKQVEEKYYKNFIANLIAQFDVESRGFEIEHNLADPYATLKVRELIHSKPLKLSLLGPEESEPETNNSNSDNNKFSFELYFNYGEKCFPGEIKTEADVSVHHDTETDDYTFVKTPRQPEWEKEVINKIKDLGLVLHFGKATLPRTDGLAWINSYLNQEGETPAFLIQDSPAEAPKYFFGKMTFELKINENRDWFDIEARIRFGEFEIPFIQIRNLILNKQKEFLLPNGEIAIIPQEWIDQYAELLAFAKENKETDQFYLSHHHISLVEDAQNGGTAQVRISEKLQKLRNFTAIEPCELPKGFKGTLRPYQKAGLDWMLFLNKYKFGGCLADDMGLGKTVQTLTLLQYQKELGEGKPSLLVAPTSLMYNWEMEAKKFCPKLKVMNYTGSAREKSVGSFPYYDVIMTSYGTLRADIEMLEMFPFNYIVLDESQAIKNPNSIISKSVTRLRANHKLILTGTPLENSTMDLWSQMNFINPGLLGSLNFFKNEFLNPIEKRGSEQKLQKLHAIVKPFIMRRSKMQVATELPEKVESVQYCTMPAEHAEEYESAKNFYRNQILERIETMGVAQSQLFVLQGLTQLRQIANHPKMVEESYTGGSGKLEDVIYKLQEAIDENHKVLVFSQFVKHLKIVKEELESRNINFAYLDGSTRDRREPVDTFQTNPDVKVFLISLKAGGTGLNLTAADYVFILDPWWNPAIEAQAIDRAHRIGQDKTVFIYKFITRETVEEKILTLQQGKRKLMQDLIITEESFVKSLSAKDITEILE
jgi:SNF2 family DNA or RNA helicase